MTDAEVTIRSDHLPLKKFLNKQTMNSKVNNWAVELEQFRLHLEWIPGTRNLLADSLSRLLDIVPDAQKTKEPDDQEFGSYCFEDLEPAKVMEKVSTDVVELLDNSEYQKDSHELRKSLEKPVESEISIKKRRRRTLTASFQNILKIHRRSRQLRLSRSSLKRSQRKDELCLVVANVKKILKNRG